MAVNVAKAGVVAVLRLPPTDLITKTGVVAVWRSPLIAYQVKSHQAATYALASQPADEAKATQTPVALVAAAETSSGKYDVYAHQVALYALVRGNIGKPHVKAWTFSLDGHDFYVLRLSTLWTMVLDLTTGQWSEWSGHSLAYWRPIRGINWVGIGYTTADRLYGTNVVCGDDRAGVLWMLDPTTGIDDGPAAGTEAYTRAVTALIPAKMRETQQCGGVYLNTSLGVLISGASADLTLRYSDNWGQSYTSAGTVTITSGDYTQEVAWRSLGLVRAPGRLFEVSDEGAAVRINYAEMK